MNEPVTIVGAISSALTASISILLFLKVDPMLVGAVNTAIIGWLGVAVVIVRAKVTPTKNVALTKQDVAVLQSAPAAP